MALGPKKGGVLARLANLGKRACYTLEGVIECLSPKKKKPRLTKEREEVSKLQVRFQSTQEKMRSPSKNA